MSADAHTHPLKILLVDDDPDFIAYFLLHSEPYNLSFDNCQNIQEARQQIHSNLYDAYIIDLNLPDGSGIDLVHEIRTGKGINKPIAIISGFLRDEQLLRLLKDKYSVDYILDKPIYPQQINTLLTHLSHYSPENLDESWHMPDDFTKEYIKTIADKLKLLEELITTAQATPGRESLTELKNAVHKIAGSAGTYGFSDVSARCKEMESQINRQLSFDTIEKEWLNSLPSFLSTLKFNFQFVETKHEVNVTDSHSSLSRPSLYVINSDAKFLELLEREKDEFSIDLMVESNPEKALKLLESQDFNPRIVVCAQTFFGSTLNAENFLELVQKKSKSSLILFAIILENESMDDRLSAIKKGIQYIFHKPLSAYVLLKSMSEALEVRGLKNFKAVVLDDDPDICRFVSSALSEIGIAVKTTENPLLLYKSLEENSPNLLFLDINTPGYNGFDLLRMLRADVIYRNLIIVIITGRSESDTLLKSHEGGADDILFKPLDKKLVQKCVLHLGRRMASIGQSIENKLGLEGSSRLIEKIHELLTAIPTPPSFLVLFRIDHYSELVFEKGQDILNGYEVSISNLLQRLQDNTISCFFINEPTFAIVFVDYDERIVKKKIFDLLSTIQHQSNLKSSFSCSIVPISKDLGTDAKLLQVAEDTLVEAMNKEAAPIKIVTLSRQSSLAKKRSVLIIEPSEELLQILKNSFESQDLTVIPFREGQPALQALINYSELQLPDLIISERKLPDMDGLEILRNLNRRFKVPIPFYFLTDFVNEKDISEGLNSGALEYITKPFSLALLVQKSMKTIFEGK